LFAGTQIAESPYAEITQQTGEELFEIRPAVDAV
jgi:hypothetical protein